MNEITLESFKSTLDALLESNPHARNKGDVFKDWCMECFGIEARISHIREQRQTTNRVSEQFRYFNPIVVFVCDASVKRDGVVKYVLERTYKQLETIAIIGVTNNHNEEESRYLYTFEQLLVFKKSVFSDWAENYFDSVEMMRLANANASGLNLNIMYPLQTIFYGAPGTGKSYKTNEVAKKYSTIRTTFHPDSDYSTFVGAYKPTTIKDNRYVMDGSNPIAMKYPDNDEKESRRGAFIKESKIEYRFVKQAFLKSYINAWKLFAVVDNEEVKPQFLIIEEINRGNCAQIFGDLFQLLDRKDGFSEYPVEADEDIRKSLISEDTKIDPSFGEKGLQFTDTQKDAINSVFNKDEDTPFRNVADDIACGKVLVLPPNFYIWATMNTSDQSLFPIDSAFKRRWDWKYVRICEGKKKDGSPLNYRIRFTIPEIGGKPAETVDENWWDFVRAINKQIEEATKSEDKKLGFFFCKPDKKANDADECNTIISAETFVGKVVFYLWQDVFKDYGFKSDIFKNGDNKISFHDFYPEDMVADDTSNPEGIDLALVKTFIYKVIGKKEDKTSEATAEA